MSSAILLDNIKQTTSLVLTDAKTVLNNNGTIVFAINGSGTTFTATVDLYPVFGIGDLWTGDKVSLSISNTTPQASQTLITSHARFVAVISALTGAAGISALVEG